MSFSSPGDLPDPEVEPGSSVLQADSLPSEPPGKPHDKETKILNVFMSDGLESDSEWVIRNNFWIEFAFLETEWYFVFVLKSRAEFLLFFHAVTLPSLSVHPQCGRVKMRRCHRVHTSGMFTPLRCTPSVQPLQGVVMIEAFT